MTPAALRPTLLRALSVLRWMQVYTYSRPIEQLPGRTRLALSKLTMCVDALFGACGFAPAAGGRAEPDWAALASAEAATQHAWLISLMLYLRSHLPAGPPEVARPAPPKPPGWTGPFGARPPRPNVRGPLPEFVPDGGGETAEAAAADEDDDEMN